MDRLIIMIDFKKYHLLTTLLKVDYPIIFVCTSERNDFLLCVESDSNNEFEEWVSVFLNPNEYYKLIYGELSLQDAFKLRDSISYLKIKHLFENDSYDIERYSGVPVDVIDFNEQSFYKCADIGPVLLEKYFNKDLAFGFDFNPHTNSHEINAGLFAEIVISIKSFFNNLIGKIRDDKLCISLYPESFLICFTYNGADTTDRAVATAVDNLYKVIAAKDHKELEDNLMSISKTSIIKPVKRVLGCLSKSNTDFYFFSNADSINKQYKKVSLPVIKNISKTISDLKADQEVVEFDGILKSYDTVSNKFKFDIGNRIIKGKFSPKFLVEQTLVLKEYKATFNKITYSSDNFKSDKVVFELLKLE